MTLDQLKGTIAELVMYLICLFILLAIGWAIEGIVNGIFRLLKVIGL